MAASSDGYLFYRTAVGSDLTTQTALASGVTGAAVAVCTVRNTGSHIHVQRIRVVPGSYGVGSIAFREVDATGTLIAIVTQPAADASGANIDATVPPLIDFGPKGWKMTVGVSLVAVRSSATGPAANVVIEAYGALSTGPVAMGPTN